MKIHIVAKGTNADGSTLFCFATDADYIGKRVEELQAVAMRDRGTGVDKELLSHRRATYLDLTKDSRYEGRVARGHTAGNDLSTILGDVILAGRITRIWLMVLLDIQFSVENIGYLGIWSIQNRRIAQLKSSW